MKIFSKLEYILIFIISAILITGCESLVNDLDASKIPEVSSKLVVESFIGTSEDSIYVTVTESSPLFGVVNNEIKYIQNANVELSDGTNSTQIPWNKDTKRYSLASQNFTITPGQTYYLTVSDESRKVTANCTVPPIKAAILEFKIDSNEAQNRNDSSMVIQISWQDIQNTTNYYAVRGYGLIKTSTQSWDYTNGQLVHTNQEYKTPLKLGRNNDDFILQNDINLDGSILIAPTLRFFFPKNTFQSFTSPAGVAYTYYIVSEVVKTHIEILNVDENYYKYHRTLGQDNNNGNPFVEPTLTFTNIKGGLGCFGAYNATIEEISNK